MMPTPTEPPVRPRPRKRPVAPNGHAAPAFARDPTEPTSEDLAAWSAGATALARMPAKERLKLTDAIPALRLEARRELERGEDRVNRLRWESEAMLESGIGAKLGARILAGVATDPPPPLLIGRLDPLGHTILYGTGGVGKGTRSASWITALLNDEKRVLIVDYENHPDEWARRIAGFGAAELMSRILHVAPLTAAYGAKRGALWVQVEDLRDLAMQFEADYMVVDSLVPACAGSDPLKPEAVSLYTGALEYIGLPTLSLGHTDKAENLRYPFGSVFWHNLARVTYSLKADGAAVILQNRKHNNYARVAPQKVTVTWNPDGLPLEAWEQSYAEDLARRISQVLIGQSLTVRAICEQLDEEADDESDPVKDDTVYRALRRGARAKPPRFVITDGKRWSNAP